MYRVCGKCKKCGNVHWFVRKYHPRYKNVIFPNVRDFTTRNGRTQHTSLFSFVTFGAWRNVRKLFFLLLSEPATAGPATAHVKADQRQRNDGAEIEEKARLIRRWHCEQQTNERTSVWVRKEGVDYDDQPSGITGSHRVQCYHYWYHYLCDTVYDSLNYTSTRINSSYC